MLEGGPLHGEVLVVDGSPSHYFLAVAPNLKAAQEFLNDESDIPPVTGIPTLTFNRTEIVRKVRGAYVRIYTLGNPVLN